jgi:hypothetical protein
MDKKERIEAVQEAIENNREAAAELGLSPGDVVIAHQQSHCIQIHTLETKVEALTQVAEGLVRAMGALSAILQRKGVVNPSELIAELEGDALNQATDDDKENWN